eukprot:CAMPEP_0185410330 /NCGR_PEP_ID=MMETSP1365-20130426/3014_1 /TAXON_ID=38817 /ORGANISM="Gephyrocapsa oceanica, Strain RCC1303" /LENGTH=97 /DNA_ID=CAMNT_0028012933 /DNA_START=572 /DNA_END=866 /DNA_ORIENTATION=-
MADEGGDLQPQRASSGLKNIADADRSRVQRPSLAVRSFQKHVFAPRAGGNRERQRMAKTAFIHREDGIVVRLELQEERSRSDVLIAKIILVPQRPVL